MKSTLTLLVVVLLILSPHISAQTAQNGDVNCDEAINILDITGIISYLYQGGPPPCPFISPGVSYITLESTVEDLGEYFTTITYIPLDAPENGYANIEFSLYVASEAYCMEFSIGAVRKDGSFDEKSFPSYIMAYTSDMPISWQQMFPVDSGMNYFGLYVRSCPRDKVMLDTAESSDKYLVSFNNVNLSATYYPLYYGSSPGKK